MIIRELRKEDIDKVISIINCNYDEVMIKEHSKNVLERFKVHNTIENFEKQMMWKEILVVEQNGSIIASGALANFGDNTYPKYSISNFFVEPQYHGNGIGRQLFNHILESVRNKGITSLHVPSSRTGFEFYKRMGFSKDDIQNDDIDEITWMTMYVC